MNFKTKFLSLIFVVVFLFFNFSFSLSSDCKYSDAKKILYLKDKAEDYYYKDKYDKAIYYYTKFINCDEFMYDFAKKKGTEKIAVFLYTIAYNNRGIAYGKNYKYDSAIIDYNKAIEINPQYKDAYDNRGNAYVKKGNYDKAIKDLKKSADLGNEKARETLKKVFNIDY